MLTYTFPQKLHGIHIEGHYKSQTLDDKATPSLYNTLQCRPYTSPFRVA